MNDYDTLPSPIPTVQRGDRLSYATHGGTVRRVLVTGTDIETNGRPVFDGIVLEGPERGETVWGYLGQVFEIEERTMGWTVSFRCHGIVIDRVPVRAQTEMEAIDLARALVVARASLGGAESTHTADACAVLDDAALASL